MALARVGVGQLAMLALIAVPLLSGHPADAAERLRRAISDLPGVPAGAMDVGQDEEGFVWIAGIEGLARFDGVEALPWAPEIIDEALEFVETGPGAAVLAGSTRGGLYEVEFETALRIVGPDGAPIEPTRHAVHADDGALWVLRDNGTLMRRRQGGSWMVLGAGLLGGEHGRGLLRAGSGAVIVGTLQGGVWRVEPDGSSEAIATGLGGGLGRWMLPDGDGSLLVLARGVGIVRVGGSEPEVLLSNAHRPAGLALDEDAVWASFTDRVYRAPRDGGPVEALEPADGFVAGGELLVDRDQGLWVTSYRGVDFYPEPRTTMWTRLDKSSRFLAESVHRTNGGWWAASWEGGPAFLRDGETRWKLVEMPDFSAHFGCPDAERRIWQSAWIREGSPRPGSVLYAWSGEEATRHLIRPVFLQLACDRTADGALWMAYGSELLTLRPGEDEPFLVSRLPVNSVRALGLLADEEGLAVLFGEGDLCEAAWGPGGFEPAGPWTCRRPPGGGWMQGLARGPDGRPWAGTNGNGVLALENGAWEPALPRGTLRDPSTGALTPSRDGSLWIATRVERIRVADVGGRVEVVERLTEANGVPSWTGAGVHELENGDLWVPTRLGPVYLPRSARRLESDPPGLRLTSVSVDGQRGAPTGSVRLRSPHRSFEARFSTFAYRDLEELAYRMRLGPDEPWRPLDTPVVRFAGMAPGRYDLQVAASLDGARWSSGHPALTLRVLPSWYARPWVWALAAVALFGLALGAQRLRLAHLLRLERQRTRIAMDLHDEVGAAVGSIGMMAAVAADDGIEPGRRLTVARRITRAAEELGGTLHDIIWSLRIREADLGALAALLCERGARFFADGKTTFKTRMPKDWPPASLPLPVRRSVQRIVIEALHNAARHAGASAVELGFAPCERGWTAWVEDDGVGIDAGPSTATGNRLGLETMERRAREIGAELVVCRGAGGGSRVELMFDLRGRRLRPVRRPRDTSPTSRPRRSPVRSPGESLP